MQQISRHIDILLSLQHEGDLDFVHFSYVNESHENQDSKNS